MMKKHPLEEMLDHYINDDVERAQKLFHDYIVKKARQKYEELLAEDDTLLEDVDLENFDNFDVETEKQNVRAQKHHSTGLGENDDVNDNDESDFDELDSDDENDEQNEKDSDLEQHEDSDDDVEEKVADLEAELAQLKAEFERLMNEDSFDDENDEGDDLDDEDLDDEDDGVEQEDEENRDLDDEDLDDEDLDDENHFDHDDMKNEDEELVEDQDEEADDLKLDDMFEDASDFDDLTESTAENYLQRVKFDPEEDHVGVGGQTPKLKPNTRSALSQRKFNDRADHAGASEIRSKNHVGFDLEQAPAVQQLGKFSNVHKNAMATLMNVPAEGTKNAILNSEEGFGKPNVVSPLSGRLKNKGD